MIGGHESGAEVVNGIYNDSNEMAPERPNKEDELCLPALITLRAESGCSIDFEAMAYCQ